MLAAIVELTRKPPTAREKAERQSLIDKRFDFPSYGWSLLRKLDAVDMPVSVIVPTAISVSASSTAPLYGRDVAFTATVTVPDGDPVPTSADGTVTFYDGSTVLGTQALSGSTATATLTTAALAPGAAPGIEDESPDAEAEAEVEAPAKAKKRAGQKQ